MSDSKLILLEALLVIVTLVVFAVWQFRDLRRAREQTRRAREEQARHEGGPREGGEGGSG